MIVTEKQLLVLFELSTWFARSKIEFTHNIPPFTREIVTQVVNQIYNQQSDDPIKITEDKEPDNE